jgi:CHASE3 domain sensor protein
MTRLLKRNVILFFFLLGIVLLTASGVVFYMQFQRTLDYNAASVESYQTIRAANGTILSIDDAAINVGSYLQTGDPANLSNLSEIIISAQVNLSTLHQLIKDDVHQSTLFNQLTPLVDQKIQFLRKIVADTMAGDKRAALEAASSTDRLKLSSQIKQLVTLIKRLEVIQLNHTDIQFKNSLKMANILYLCSGIICLLIFVFTYISLRKYLK